MKKNKKDVNKQIKYPIHFQNSGKNLIMERLKIPSDYFLI